MVGTLCTAPLSYWNRFYSIQRQTSGHILQHINNFQLISFVLYFNLTESTNLKEFLNLTIISLLFMNCKCFVISRHYRYRYRYKWLLRHLNNPYSSVKKYKTLVREKSVQDSSHQIAAPSYCNGSQGLFIEKSHLVQNLHL